MIWTRDYREQIQLVVRAELKLGAFELQVQRSNPLGQAASTYFVTPEENCFGKWDWQVSRFLSFSV